MERVAIDHSPIKSPTIREKPSEDVKRINSFKYELFDMSIEEFGAKLNQQRFDEAQPKNWWDKVRSKVVGA